MNKKYFSPITSEELFLGEDGLLHSNFNNMLYALDGNGNAILLKSPISNKPLYKSLDGYFRCVDEDDKFEIRDGMIQLVNYDIKKNTVVDEHNDEKITNSNLSKVVDDSIVNIDSIPTSNTKGNASIESILVVIIVLLLLVTLGVVIFIIF